MTIKLIAIDMDGTLLNSNHEISKRVKQAITSARQQGVYVVLTTGRPYIGVKSYLQQLGIQNDDEYCITYNGALVQQVVSGTPVIENTLNYEDYLYFQQLSESLGVHFHAFDFTDLYTPNRFISPYTIREGYLTGIQVIFCPAEEMDPHIQLPKVMMIDDPALLDAAIKKIPEDAFQKYTLLKSADFFLEILSKKADKGISVAKLAERLSIDRQQVMAIGDHANDLPMVSYAGIGVAMANAIDEVKHVSQYITTSNDEDGVALAIEKFVLNN